jgi:hypothetical protein
MSIGGYRFTWTELAIDALGGLFVLVVLIGLCALAIAVAPPQVPQ